MSSIDTNNLQFCKAYMFILYIDLHKTDITYRVNTYSTGAYESLSTTDAEMSHRRHVTIVTDYYIKHIELRGSFAIINVDEVGVCR